MKQLYSFLFNKEISPSYRFVIRHNNHDILLITEENKTNRRRVLNVIYHHTRMDLEMKEAGFYCLKKVLLYTPSQLLAT